jgi:hypothetical protein
MASIELQPLEGRIPPAEDRAQDAAHQARPSVAVVAVRTGKDLHLSEFVAGPRTGGSGGDRDDHQHRAQSKHVHGVERVLRVAKLLRVFVDRVRDGIGVVLPAPSGKLGCRLDGLLRILRIEAPVQRAFRVVHFVAGVECRYDVMFVIFRARLFFRLNGQPQQPCSKPHAHKRHACRPANCARLPTC